MKHSIILIFILMGLVSSVWAESVEDQGRVILEKLDLRFNPVEGSYDMVVGEIKSDNSRREYEMQIYKQGKLKQTAVWKAPAVMKNTVSIRSGDTIYYKPLKAFRPDIMSYQAIFMDSGFSWGDVISADLSGDYKAEKIKEVTEDGTELYFLEIIPTKENRYAKIEVWIDKKTYSCKKRLYYTASGEVLKQALYSGITEKNGKVTGYRIDIEDFFMETNSYAVISNIKEESLPNFLFDVKNISRIHVR